MQAVGEFFSIKIIILIFILSPSNLQTLPRESRPTIELTWGETATTQVKGKKTR
jgi:hypothetical protein